MGVVLDIVEPREGIVFITGYVVDRLSVGHIFTSLGVYQPAKKRNQQPQQLSVIDVRLTVNSIIIDGEPVDAIEGDITAQIGLTGEVDALLSLLTEHHWHERNGRYLLPRNETRLLMLSGE